MILSIIQVIIAILLIVVILLQMKGSGLSTAFGGSGEFYRSRRNIEKLLVWATVFLSSIYAILSILLLLPR